MNSVTVDTRVTNKQVSNYLSSKSQSASQNAVNINNMKLTIGKMKGGCDIDVSQKITSTQKMVATLSPTDTQEIKSRIANDLKSQVDQAAEAKRGAFATGDTSSANVQNYKTQVDNIVESNLKDEQVQKLFQSGFNANNNEIHIDECGSGPFAFTSSKLNASQNIASDMAAEAIMKGITQQLADLDVKSGVSTYATQHAHSENTGPIQDLFDGIAKILAGLGLAMLAPAVAMACCVCCCCCVALIAMLMMGGSSGGGGAGPYIGSLS
jgi:hypothetical protein